MQTLTIEQTPHIIQNTILMDDWVAFIPFKTPCFLFLCLHKYEKQWVSHLYNLTTNGYSYGRYFHSYEIALSGLKERREEWVKPYELGELIVIEGEYGNE